MSEQQANAVEALNTDRGGLNRLLGIVIVEASRERVVATMPVTPDHHQPFGYLHGGASLVLAETVASVGGWLNCPPGKVAFGLEINANHLRPKQDGTLTAVATPLHSGQTTSVWEIKIADEKQKLICVARCTVALVPAQREAEPQRSSDLKQDHGENQPGDGGSQSSATQSINTSS